MQKRITTWLLTLLVAISAVFSLAACGEGDSTPQYTGTYKFYSLKAEVLGVEMELKAGDSYLLFALSENIVNVVLAEDGSLEIKALSGLFTPATGTWELSEENANKISMTVSGATGIWDCDGSTLQMVINGLYVTLKK